MMMQPKAILLNHMCRHQPNSTRMLYLLKRIQDIMLGLMDRKIGLKSVTFSDKVPTAKEGETVKIIASPEDGYFVNSINVDSGSVVEKTDENNYTFTMPAQNVVISAQFSKIGEPTSTPAPTAEPTAPPTAEPSASPTTETVCNTECKPADRNAEYSRNILQKNIQSLKTEK